MSILKSHIVSFQESELRIDSLLVQSGCFESRSAAAKAIESNRVLLNGATPAKNTKVKAGDTIVYEVVETTQVKLEGQNIPLDVRYEDEDLLVISKQRGLVCHPCPDYIDSTLVNALIYHCGAEHLCNVQGDFDRPGIVHRLDQGTSGLMMAAKTNLAGTLLMQAIQNKEVERKYLALVHGVISLDSGLIDAPIARCVSDRKKMTVRDGASSRNAITSFQVLERFEPHNKNDGYTLVECKLFTGRTHQIRVHMQYIKHPVVGDGVYTASMPKHHAANLGLERQFLHSYSLVFDHPINGNNLSFYDNMASDLMNAYNSIKPFSREITNYGAEIFEQLKNAPVPSIRD